MKPPNQSSEEDNAAVDDSLIDMMLALTPEERLRENDRMVRTIHLLRQACPQPPDPDDAHQP